MKSKEFGRYIKKLREDRKMSLLEVERTAKISNSYLSQIESGERGIPHFDTLVKLSKAYGVSVKELLIKAELASEGKEIPKETDLDFVSRGYEKLTEDERKQMKDFLGFLLEKRKH